MEAEYRVHLANPAAMQQYSGLKYTDDDSDARWLAHLLRLGVLPQGYIYPKAARAVRDLLRKRAHLVRQHTANVRSCTRSLRLIPQPDKSGKMLSLQHVYEGVLSWSVVYLWPADNCSALKTRYNAPLSSHGEGAMP